MNSDDRGRELVQAVVERVVGSIADVDIWLVAKKRGIGDESHQA